MRSAVVKGAISAGRATSVSFKNLLGIWQYLVDTPTRMQGVKPVSVSQDRSHEAGHGKVICFTDADHAGDIRDGKSTSGIMIWVSARGQVFPVLHASKKQGVVSLSSGESEVTALTQGVAWACGVRTIWADILEGLGHEVVSELSVGCDSSCAVKLARRKGASQRTRHLTVKAFYLQALTRMPWCTLGHVRGTHIWADVLTKVGRVWSTRHLECLGIIHAP